MMGRWMLLGGLCTVLCSLSPHLLHAASELRFGVYTTDKPTAMVKKLRPLLNALETDLSQRLGEPVTIRMQAARDYAQGLQDLVTGKVDMARLGPASYVRAKAANPQIRILAMENHRGGKTFHGVICVHADSAIHQVRDLKGKRFAFGNAHSTFGRYLSQQYLLDHGLTASDLAGFAFLGRHDKVGEAVGAGGFDAGALKENTFDKLVRQGVPLRALAKLPIVTRPWVARSGFPEPLYRAVQDALLQLKAPKALKALKKDGFLLGRDADYDGIRASMARAAVFDPHGVMAVE
ncbi:MAG: PhnD/SsuA/transferrin family substrate-binding protein [Candidatus Tectomicrobia bacterium]|nr:PhnD/SsuA/transferrin family substrate-binding protein [Candidatus Tectomicrobia bacterium]